MKKLKLILFLFPVFICFSCGKQEICDGDYTYYLPSEMSLHYFQCFDAGNSWTYINQDSTKTDSLYLKYGYPYSNGVTDWGCYASYDRKTVLYSSYLYQNPEYPVECCYSGNNNNNTYFTFSDGLSYGIFVHFSFDNLADTLRFGVDSDFYMLDSIDLPNGYRHYDVINWNDQIWFAPDTGITQYLSFDKQDTFYLNKFYPK